VLAFSISQRPFRPATVSISSFLVSFSTLLHRWHLEPSDSQCLSRSKHSYMYFQPNFVHLLSCISLWEGMDDPLPRLLSFGPDVFDLTKQNYNSCGWHGVSCSTSGTLIYIHDSNLLSIQATVIFPSLIVHVKTRYFCTLHVLHLISAII
jgi:hypothetical protein